MANPFEQVLLELGIDLSPVQEAGKVVLATVADLNKITDQYQSKTQAGYNDQLSKIKLAAAAAVQAAMVAVAEETKKQSILASQTKEYAKQAAEQKVATETSRASVAVEQTKTAALKTETSELEKQKALRQAETAEIQKQIAELRLKKAEESEHGGGEGHGGHSPFQTLLSAALGRTLGPAIVGGLAGGGLAIGIEAAVLKAENFIEKLKEVTIEANKLTQVSDVFERLAAGKGINASEMLTKLRENTEGLISKLSLTRVAVAALSNDFKLQHGVLEEATGAVVKLAEAHGKDAQGAIERFARGLEMGRINARALGIGVQQAELQLKGLPPNMDAVSKKAAEIAHGLEVIIKRGKELGELPQTLEQMKVRMDVLVKDMFESFGKGFNESLGAQTFIRFMAGNVDAMTAFEAKIEEWGRALGQALGVVGPMLAIIKTIIVEIIDIVGHSITTIGTLFGVIKKDGDGAEATIRKIGHAFIYVNVGIGVVAASIKILLEDLKLLGPVLKDLAAFGTGTNHAAATVNLAADMADLMAAIKGGKLKEVAKPVIEELKTQYGHILQDFDDSLDKAAESLKHKAPIEKPDTETTETWQQKMKLAQLRLQLAHKLAAEELAQRKADLSELRRLDDEAYSSGEETLEQHWTNQRDIAKKQRDARDAETHENYNAQIEEFKEAAKGMLGGPPPDTNASAQAIAAYQDKVKHSTSEFALKEAAEKASRDRKLIQSESQLQQELYKIDNQADDTRRANAIKVMHDEAAIAIARVHLLQEINEKQFQAGEKSPDAYFKRQIDLTEQLAVSEMLSAQSVYDAGKKQEKDLEELDNKKNKAREEAEKSFTLMLQGEAQKRLQYVQKQFQPQQQAIETQIGYQRTGTSQEQAEMPQLLARLLTNLSSQRTALESALSTAKPYSDTWYQIYGAIEKTYQSQVKYNLELRKMADLLGPISQTFGALGKDIKEVFTSKFAQNLGATVESAAQQIGKAKERGDVIFGRGGVSKDPAMAKLETEASKLFSNTNDSSRGLASNLDTLSLAVQRVTAVLNGVGGPGSGAAGTNGGDFSEEESVPGSPQGTSADSGGEYSPNSSQAQLGQSFDTITKKVVATADALAGFISTLTSAKSALSGGVGGALSGAGTGSMFGPWGAAAGAVVGGTLGAVLGSKQAKVKENIDKLNTTYKRVMDEFAQNSNNLQNTIIQIQALLQSAQQLQASSKKGSSGYQKAIDQYTQQLMQLQNQQQQTIIEMNKQLAILSAPIGAQGMLGDLKSILEQYQKFEGAAKSAQDLANANKFLVESLQQYETNLETQLNTDNTQAINDALQLNDLLYQRTQIIQQYNNQVQGVLTQGNVTRQFTRAQTAGQQIQQLRVAFDRQMEQMNEEISATQFKVAAEGKIFDLATTRVGLETQLLVLQNGQTKIDMARISALSALVSQLQAGDYTKGALGALLAAIPTVSSPLIGGSQNLLQALMNIAAEAGGGQMQQSFEEIVASAYQDRASLGFGAFNGANL